MFTDQNTELLREFAKLTQQLTQSQDDFGQLELQMNRLLGDPAALDDITIEECDEVERALKSSLERVEAKKVCMNNVHPCEVFRVIRYTLCAHV